MRWLNKERWNNIDYIFAWISEAKPKMNKIQINKNWQKTIF
jgi:hypothetical protein